ncbi:MAG: hypothetical protein HY046_01580 [Acidobacteria bacterium]|nr:hypothetical protein [Acidobacteriota bacterium]
MKKFANVLLAVAVFLAIAAPAFAQGTAATGTSIPITLTDSISSKDAKVGQKVSGSVTNDVVSGGKVVIPKGSTATLTVTSADPSGRLSGTAKIGLRLQSVVVRGTTYNLTTGSIVRTGSGHAKRNTVAVGGGAAAGAIIGGLAGGGKGAAIGAGVGAGAGTAGAAATGKKDITLGSETKLTFALKADLTTK